jgi:transcription-repair coupling factor (superfamily II helicase)
MNDRELEDIMLAFVNRQFDVLICTTIIESGLDIPNVNTIIVEDADHMGLAQLYQLRGRVGRSNRLAYAYITHRRDKVITEESEKRLAAIREFTELGSGFRIAMRDMEIRGVGNLLGTEQHGHMESVGYDMYCRLLDEAVREIERERAAGEGGQPADGARKPDGARDSGVDEVALVSLDIRINAYIDGLYIDDETLRLEMYQKIASARSEEDIGDIADEMIDRFSSMPQETENLISLTRMKVLAAGCGISSITEKTGQVIMQIKPNGGFSVENLSSASRKYKGRVLFNAGASPYIVFKPASGPIAQSGAERAAISEIIGFLTNLSGRPA